MFICSTEESSMKKSFAAFAAVLAVSAGFVVAAEIQSGLEKGKSVPPFVVKDVTGPNKDGDELCYRCRYGNQPVVSIFAKEMTEEVAQLSKELDNAVAKNRDQKMAGFVVLMTEDPEKAAPALTAAAAKHKISQMPLTTFNGTKGPDGYKINSKADVTVMMWVDGKVKLSQGMSKSDLNKETIAKLVSETKTILE
jgi:hypothetical protein